MVAHDHIVVNPESEHESRSLYDVKEDTTIQVVQEDHHFVVAPRTNVVAADIGVEVSPSSGHV